MSATFLLDLSINSNLKSSINDLEPMTHEVHLTRNLAELSLEITNSWSDINKDVPKKNFKMLKPKEEQKKLITAYKLGNETTLPFILLGSADIRSDQSLIENFGTLATEPQASFKDLKHLFLNDNSDQSKNSPKERIRQHLTQGSIINDSNWWPPRNDMFIMGAIDARKEFHLMSKNGKVPTDDFLWDAEEKRPRVLGRELIMLREAEYQSLSNSKYGYVFLPPCHKTSSISYGEFRNGIKQVKDVNIIRKFITG